MHTITKRRKRSDLFNAGIEWGEILYKLFTLFAWVGRWDFVDTDRQLFQDLLKSYYGTAMPNGIDQVTLFNNTNEEHEMSRWPNIDSFNVNVHNLFSIGNQPPVVNLAQRGLTRQDLDGMTG